MIRRSFQSQRNCEKGWVRPWEPLRKAAESGRRAGHFAGASFSHRPNGRITRNSQTDRSPLSLSKLRPLPKSPKTSPLSESLCLKSPRNKHIYVLEDGLKLRTDESPSAFRYVLCEGAFWTTFLKICRERLSPGKSYSYVYTFTGLEIQSFPSLPVDAKVLLVSDRPKFQGLSWDRVQTLTEGSVYQICLSLDTTRPRLLIESKRPIRRKSVPMAQRKMSVERDRKHSPSNSVEKCLKPLTPDQISDLACRYGFGRGKVHELYARFKTLLGFYIRQNPGRGIDHADVSQGIDKDTFINHTRGALIHGRDLLSRLFDAIDVNRNGMIHPGFLTWADFIEAMSFLSVGSRRDKLSLYFRVPAILVV